MPGNLRTKTKRGGVTEADYERARRRKMRESQMCAVCFNAIDLSLKPICQYVDTRGVPVEEAHLIPLDCGPGCREAGHARKSNPWSYSADHKIPVDSLLPGSKLLTSVKNLASTHLRCNQLKGSSKSAKALNKTSRDWFA